MHRRSPRRLSRAPPRDACLRRAAPSCGSLTASSSAPWDSSSGMGRRSDVCSRWRRRRSVRIGRWRSRTRGRQCGGGGGVRRRCGAARARAARDAQPGVGPLAAAERRPLGSARQLRVGYAHPVIDPAGLRRGVWRRADAGAAARQLAPPPLPPARRPRRRPPARPHLPLGSFFRPTDLSRRSDVPAVATAAAALACLVGGASVPSPFPATAPPKTPRRRRRRRRPTPAAACPASSPPRCSGSSS